MSIEVSGVSHHNGLIIGLSGRMGSGKDEIYKSALDYIGSESVQRFAFGDIVKQEVAELLDLSVGYIELKKKFFRPLLQWWGTEYRRALYGRNYWLDQMRDRLNSDRNKEFAFVTDVRFVNEANLIKSLGGIMVRVQRPGFIMCDKTKDHTSETDLDNYDFDHTITNDGGVNDLVYQVRSLIDGNRRA